MLSLKDKTVKVRKRHRCCWCGEHINIGELAEYRVYIFDGFTYDYMHPECRDAMDSMDWYGDDGFEEYFFQRGTTEERKYVEFIQADTVFG